jgi:hypothetical protein
MRRPRTMRFGVVTVVGLLLALVNVSPALAQPANDDFDTATVVGVLPFADTTGTADATTADDDPFCNGNEHSVWYAFTPTANTTIRADTVGSNYETTLSVYTGTRGALSQIACSYFPAQVTLGLSANTTYYFMVASACCGGPGGTLVFNITGPPANDELSGATPLALNTPVTEDTTLATTAPTDPSDCTFGPPQNTVWFSFTPAVSQPLELDRSGSSYSGRLSVLTDLGSGPVVIACGFGDSVRVDATAGRTYFFMDSAFVSGGGQLRLTLRPGIVMTVTVDPTGTVSRAGTAVVSGTLACNPASPPQGGAGAPTLRVVLRQKVSKTLVIQGSKDLSIPCPTATTGWSATIIGDNGPFRKGSAEAFVTGHACDPTGCDSPQVRQLIKLVGEK